MIEVKYYFKCVFKKCDINFSNFYSLSFLIFSFLIDNFFLFLNFDRSRERNRTRKEWRSKRLGEKKRGTTLGRTRGDPVNPIATVDEETATKVGRAGLEIGGDGVVADRTREKDEVGAGHEIGGDETEAARVIGRTEVEVDLTRGGIGAIVVANLVIGRRGVVADHTRGRTEVVVDQEIVRDEAGAGHVIGRGGTEAGHTRGRRRAGAGLKRDLMRTLTAIM